MRSAVIVVINPASDVLTGFPAAGEGIQIDAFIFEAAPQPFDKDVIHPAALAIHRDTNASNLQCAGPLEAGELAPLICVERDFCIMSDFFDRKQFLLLFRPFFHFFRPVGGDLGSFSTY